MTLYNGSNVINGTFGECWVGDDYIGDVLSLEAKVTIDKTDIQQVRSLTKGQKITGYSGKGTLKTNKTRSYFMKMISEALKKGQDISTTIQSKLDDPDAYGNELVVLKNVSFDELTLADWEGGKLGEESIAFTFTDWEIKNSIDHSYDKM
jgi:hypothetical protein